MSEIKEEDEKGIVNRWPAIVFMIVMALAAIAGLIVYAQIESNKTKRPVPAESGEGYLFTSKLEPRETITLVIQCDEERYQKSLNDFVTIGLNEEKADVVGVTGGPRWFVLPVHAELPSWLKPAKRVTIEFLKRYSPGKIILIAHQHCIINDVIAAWKDEKFTKEQEIEQLKQSAEILKSWFPTSEIKMYYAEERDSKLWFKAVEVAESEREKNSKKS